MDTLRDKINFSAGTLSSSQQKAQGRRLTSAEDQLKKLQQAVMWKKTRGTIFTGAFTMVCVAMLNSNFSGQVMARLPFIPFSMFRGATHYGIPGEDFRDASTTFMYMLCNLSIGQYVKRLLGLEGPRIQTPTPDILKK